MAQVIPSIVSHTTPPTTAVKAGYPGRRRLRLEPGTASSSHPPTTPPLQHPAATPHAHTTPLDLTTGGFGCCTVSGRHPRPPPIHLRRLPLAQLDRGGCLGVLAQHDPAQARDCQRCPSGECVVAYMEQAAQQAPYHQPRDSQLVSKPSAPAWCCVGLVVLYGVRSGAACLPRKTCAARTIAATTLRCPSAHPRTAVTVDAFADMCVTFPGSRTRMSPGCMVPCTLPKSNPSAHSGSLLHRSAWALMVCPRRASPASSSTGHLQSFSPCPVSRRRFSRPKGQRTATM